MADIRTSTLADAPSLLGGTDTLAGMQTFGMVLGLAGAFQSAVGAFYAVQAQQYQAESAALDAEFAGTMADINARQAEIDAQGILAAGKQAKAGLTLRHGAAKAESRARQAASGVQAGVGSAAEVQASFELAKELDVHALTDNTIRRALAARRQAVDFENRASLARVSARNLRSGGRALSPALAAGTSLLGGASGVARDWVYSKRLDRLYRDRGGVG